MGCTWSATILTQAAKHQPWLVGVKGLQSEPRAHSSHHYTTTRLDCWHGTGWVPRIHAVDIKLWQYHLRSSAEIQIHQLQLSSFHESVSAAASAFCCWLTAGLTWSSTAVARPTQGPTSCSAFVNKFFFFCNSLSKLWILLWEEVIRWNLIFWQWQ